MESDALALEYLADNDYDYKKAIFKLCAAVGCGKDHVHSSRVRRRI